MVSHPCGRETPQGWGTLGSWFPIGTLNQALRQAYAGPELALAAGHPALVGFVVVSG
jgi:hypothetical protein